MPHRSPSRYNGFRLDVFVERTGSLNVERALSSTRDTANARVVDWLKLDSCVCLWKVKRDAFKLNIDKSSKWDRKIGRAHV